MSEKGSLPVDYENFKRQLEDQGYKIVSKEEQEKPELKIKLIKSVPKIYDKHRHELSVHFRVNHATKEFEIIINRSCEKCKKFMELKDGTRICKKCKYELNWLGNGQQ